MYFICLVEDRAPTAEVIKPALESVNAVPVGCAKIYPSLVTTLYLLRVPLKFAEPSYPAETFPNVPDVNARPDVGR